MPYYEGKIRYRISAKFLGTCHDEESLLCWQLFRRSEAGTSEAGEAFFYGNWSDDHWSFSICLSLFQHLASFKTCLHSWLVDPLLEIGDTRSQIRPRMDSGVLKTPTEPPQLLHFLSINQAFGFRSSRFRDIYWCNFVDVLSLAYF